MNREESDTRGEASTRWDAQAADVVLPAAPASAQYDCSIAGPYVVYDVVDCVHYILISAIDWPPR